LGNDFITPTTNRNHHQWNNDHINEELFSDMSNNKKQFKMPLDMILAYLQNQVRGFQLTSMIPDIEETVRFIRQVYNLQQQHHPSDNVVSTTSIYEQEDLIRTLQEGTNTSSSFGSGVQRPHVSDDEMMAMDITISPQPPPSSTKKKSTMKEIILSALRNYIQYTQEEATIHNEWTNGSSTSIAITEEHLVALEQLKLKEGQSYNVVDQTVAKINLKNWRPSYSDTCVVYLIERIIIHVIENNMTSLLVQLNAPFMIFDPYKYYVQLLLIREGNKNVGYVTSGTAIATRPSMTTTSQASTTPKQQKQKGGGKRKSKTKNKNGSNGLNESAISEESENDEAKEHTVQTEIRPVLPVDEFEHQIIKSVYENRVTIIQGETGCGTWITS
jgi:hypothetical protein